MPAKAWQHWGAPALQDKTDWEHVAVCRRVVLAVSHRPRAHTTQAVCAASSARTRAHERRRQNPETDQHGTGARVGVETMARAPGTPPPRRHERCAHTVSRGSPRLLPRARVSVGTHTASIPQTAATMPHRALRRAPCCPGATPTNPAFRTLIRSLSSFPAFPIPAFSRKLYVCFHDVSTSNFDGVFLVGIF